MKDPVKQDVFEEFVEISTRGRRTVMILVRVSNGETTDETTVVQEGHTMKNLERSTRGEEIRRTMTILVRVSDGETTDKTTVVQEGHTQMFSVDADKMRTYSVEKCDVCRHQMYFDLYAA